MSLSTRSQLAATHPYFAWAVDYILSYAANNGGEFTITSIQRSAQQQWDLYARVNTTAVRPGCSQHQYGAAVDVKFKLPNWQNWYLSSVRNFGLSTVVGDPVHVQLIPGTRFREWSTSQGFCPDPRYPKETGLTIWDEIETFFVPSPSGSLSFRQRSQIIFPQTFE